MTLLLDIQDLDFSYRDRIVLESISLQLSAGESFAILGGNGAGKSTLLRLILGLLKPAPKSGQKIMVAGIDVSIEPQEARRQIAYLPEQAVLYPHLTGVENLRYMLGLTLGAAACNTDLEPHLRRVGLQQSAWHQHTSHYSKGMRQKLMIALALARDVRLMLLDEPNTGLDPAATKELNSIINELKSNGVGILMVSHDLLSIHEIADRQFILQEGHLKQIDGSVLHRSLAELNAIFSPAASSKSAL